MPPAPPAASLTKLPCPSYKLLWNCRQTAVDHSGIMNSFVSVGKLVNTVVSHDKVTLRYILILPLSEAPRQLCKAVVLWQRLRSSRGAGALHTCRLTCCCNRKVHSQPRPVSPLLLLFLPDSLGTQYCGLKPPPPPDLLCSVISEYHYYYPQTFKFKGKCLFNLF